ncbi:flagellar filament capping protein FliD [Castellaniella caeni]|uniref:flagellar filament capping protein FliD n=1 Tax=Castellaniella caeni TaxID=266123 RepID=UPI00082E9BFA|nr:flagellar filament capping protein FliD [Castellaniella caeni]
MDITSLSSGTQNSGLISSLGVGSGLPLDDLLDQLQTSENASLQPIQAQEDTANATLSAYGTLQNSISNLQAAAQPLSNPQSFNTLQANVGGSAFTATVDGGAIAGQYDVTVDQLASAQTLVTAGQASQTISNGTGGSLTITLANGTSNTLDLTGKDTSLNGLVAAINGDSALGVSATLVNDGSASPYHLLLIAQQTGTQAAVSSISSDNANLQNLLGFTQGDTGSGVTERAASNAQLHIDGVAISSPSNTLQSAITGVTLTLQSVDADPTKLDITHDTTQATQSVQNLVTAYNSVLSTLQSLTAYDTGTQTASPLTGNPLALQVQEQLNNALDTPSSSGSLSSVFSLGLSTDPTTGQLSLNTDTFSSLLASDPTDVQNVLAGASGVGQAFQTMSDQLLQTGGAFSSATEGTKNLLSDLQAQYQQQSDNISSEMDNYRQEFTALDSMMAQMNSLSSYLTQQLAGLSNG